MLARAGIHVSRCSGAWRARPASADTRSAARRCRHEGDLTHIGDGRTAGQTEGEIELREQIPDDVAHAIAAAQRQAVHPWSADEHGPGAQREGLHHVRAAANAAVEQDGKGAGHRGHHLRQRVDGTDASVDLTSAVRADDDPVHAMVNRTAGIVRMQDALEDDRQPGVVAEPAEVAPGDRRARVDVEECLDRRTW